MRDYGGEVPADRDALTALPGVGRKTANVVLNCAFGAETFAVDTHIFRVGNRTGLAPGKTPLAGRGCSWRRRVPRPFRLGAHHWLILHGRYVCKARTPECWRCPVVDLCAFKAKVLARRAGPARFVCRRSSSPGRRRWQETAHDGRNFCLLALLAAALAALPARMAIRAGPRAAVSDGADHWRAGQSCIPINQIRETRSPRRHDDRLHRQRQAGLADLCPMRPVRASSQRTSSATRPR